MVDMSIVIANNINYFLTKQHKKQVELAEYLNVSKQIVSKMLNGSRSINAIELKKIADFCGTDMETLTTIPQNYEETDVIHVFMGKVNTDAAKETIQDIDKLINLILFHNKVKENGSIMMEEMEDL